MTSVVSGFGRIMTYAFNGLDMSSAANDVIVVQQRDGTLHSSPFNVRFGKLKVLRPQDKVVSIEVNGVMTRAVMKINSEGVAFWLEPTTHVEGRPESPIASPGLSQQQPSSPQAEVPNMVLPTTKDPLQSTSVLIASTAELKESVAKLRRETDESSALQPLEDIGPANAELAEVLGTMQDGGHQDPQAVLREPATAPLEAFTQEMSEHQREKYTELLRSIEESVKNEDGQLHGLTLSKLASYEDLTMGASEPTPQTVANPSAPPSFGIAITDSEARLHIASPPHDVDVDRNSTCATDDGDFEEGTEDEEDGDVHSSTGTSHHEAPVIYFKPTTTPITADIEKLGLVPGHNRVRYMTHTSLHGRVVVESSIYLWSSDTKIVVSDIDGTVTKSDVWGHILPMIGRDWTHAGICSLYSKVSRNGYQFVYLTARSMSQQEQTSRFLWSIEQDGMTLPRGPVLTAPDRFFTALTQEVSKKAHEFKIACLKGIQRAFPKNSKPFYAGFGNRIGDVISYTATQIPKHKIFIIDTNSTLHVCRVKQSYKNLAHLVDVTFPPLKPTTLVSCPRGSSVNDGVNSPQGRSSTVSSASSSPTLASQGAGSPNFVSTVLPPSSTLSVSTATTHDDEGMDADFNSFNFWRVPPEELVAQVPVKKVSSTNTKLKPPSSPARANPNKQHAHPLLVDTSHVHAPAVVDETSAADPTRQKESKGWLRGWFGHQNQGAQQTSPQSAKVPPSGTSFKK